MVDGHDTTFTVSNCAKSEMSKKIYRWAMDVLKGYIIKYDTI